MLMKAYLKGTAPADSYLEYLHTFLEAAEELGLMHAPGYGFG